MANPGVALKNITQFMSDESTLLITTPNALAVRNFLFVLLGFEAHDPDHVAICTPRLLDNILGRSGLSIKEFNYYQSTFNGQQSGVFTNYWQNSAASLKSVIGKVAINVFLRVHPAYSDGIIVKCGKA